MQNGLGDLSHEQFGLNRHSRLLIMHKCGLRPLAEGFGSDFDFDDPFLTSLNGRPVWGFAIMADRKPGPDGAGWPRLDKWLGLWPATA